MPKGPDAAQRAVRVGKIATGQIPKDGKDADQPTLLAEMIAGSYAVGVESGGACQQDGSRTRYRVGLLRRAWGCHPCALPFGHLLIRAPDREVRGFHYTLSFRLPK